MKRSCFIGTLMATLLLSACGQQQAKQGWGLLNITGHLPDLQFTLTGSDGKQATQHDFSGKLILLYFGYTHCPDECPTTLADLGAALRLLGVQANAVRVLFVSVDPARDTPAALKSYAAAFGPQFVGLTGNQEQLQTLTRRYRVAYRLGTPDAHGAYTVFHSSAVFVFDKQGRARLIGDSGDKPGVIATDLRRLLAA